MHLQHFRGVELRPILTGREPGILESSDITHRHLQPLDILLCRLTWWSILGSNQAWSRPADLQSTASPLMLLLRTLGVP
jgi:hypothetical protein